MNKPHLCGARYKTSLMSNKVLYISQEITPYLPANEMSTIGQKLPQYAQENGYEVRIFMPKYGSINERRNQLHEVIRLSGMNVVIDDTDHPLIIKVATLLPTRMQVYFIDSDDYFVHKSIGGLELDLYPEDNDERLMFFSVGVIETVKKLRWEPQIIHCQGWITALAPVYIKTLYADDPMFRNAKVVFGIYDNLFEETLAPRFVEKLEQVGLPDDLIASIKGKEFNCAELSKLAIQYSDAVAIASPNANYELVEYARSLGKPVVCPTDSAEFKDYINLYENML